MGDQIYPVLVNEAIIQRNLISLNFNHTSVHTLHVLHSLETHICAPSSIEQK